MFSSKKSRVHASFPHEGIFNKMSHVIYSNKLVIAIYFQTRGLYIASGHHEMLSNKRVHGVRRYSTLVVFVPRHFDISVYSPAFTPTVLYQPIVLSILYTISHN